MLRGVAVGVEREWNFDSRGRELPPEAALWCEVIAFAVREARGRADTAHRAAARSFLTGRAVLDVLHVLGLDPDWWSTRVIPHLVATWRDLDAAPRERKPADIASRIEAARKAVATRAAKRAAAEPVEVRLAG